MKAVQKSKGFLYSIVSTILICIFIMIYCIAMGEIWTYPMMDDPLFFIQVGQIASAIIVAIILALFKHTRKNGLWFILPAILIVFAFLYDFILNLIYPCC